MSKITKTPNEIRDDYLRTVKNGLINIGIPNPNVSENSDYWIQATALADQISSLFNNVEVAADQLMPDTATGTDLDRLISMFGLSRRPAGGATGQCTIVCTAPTFVVTNAELANSVGGVYQVRTGGTFSNGAIIDLISKDTGAKTNLAVGSTLVWVSPPAATQSTTTVTTPITGGVDAEDDETARARLLSRLAHPPGSGNWQQVAELAESTDPAVQKAFVYPAANGPSTVHIAVAGYPSTVSKSRAVDTLKLNAIIIPTILGSLPEYTEAIITTVVNVPTDVSINITLPLATGVASTGPQGGGWLDATPFPQLNANYFYIPITAVTDSTHFTIDSPAGVDPTAGISRVMWIDKNTWTVKQATITGFTTGAGPYALTIDTPFVGVAVNDWIFPASVNAQLYLNAVLDSFKQMGPGEKTDQVGLLPRASRKPRPSSGYAMSLDSQMLKRVINSANEVETAAFYYRGISTPATQISTGVVTPAVCTVITNAPNILIPRNIGLYPPTPLT
jgi:uncharacterized phage protein gp47/JayE